MKTSIIIVVLSSLISAAYSQKCIIIKNETDQFTGNKVIKTGYQTLVAGFRFSVQKINEFIYLEMTVGLMDVFSVDKGNEMILLFEDGSKLSLNNMEYTIADPINASGITAWNAQLSFILSDDAVVGLNNKSVVAVRVYSNNGYLDGEVKPKNRSKIMDALQCINNVQ